MKDIVWSKGKYRHNSRTSCGGSNLHIYKMEKMWSQTVGTYDNELF